MISTKFTVLLVMEVSIMVIKMKILARKVMITMLLMTATVMMTWTTIEQGVSSCKTTKLCLLLCTCRTAVNKEDFSMFNYTKLLLSLRNSKEILLEAFKSQSPAEYLSLIVETSVILISGDSGRNIISIKA
jgi:hypothetical protein